MPRPSSKPGGERIPLQTRTTAATRDRLQEAAERSGRSLSQEMETRLEQSLLINDIVTHAMRQAKENAMPVVDMLGGPATFSVLRDIAMVVKWVEDDIGGPWHQDASTRAKLYRALEAILPSVLRHPVREDILDGADPYGRVLELMKLLPSDQMENEPSKHVRSARFANVDELKQIFGRRDD